MTKEEIFTRLIGSIQQSESLLKLARSDAERLGKELGYSADKIGELVESYAKRTTSTEESVQVLEGVFDGQNMKGPEGKIYPVPANYASKSKLVEGDHLKLTIAENGAFIYKQIEPVERQLLLGHLVLDGSRYQVVTSKKAYNVLFASVTFFRAKVGDQITIIVPVGIDSAWAAIENVIPQIEGEEKSSEISEDISSETKKKKKKEI